MGGQKTFRPAYPLLRNVSITLTSRSTPGEAGALSRQRPLYHAQAGALRWLAYMVGAINTKGSEGGSIIAK
jgi:hypothetical protein